MLVLLLSRVSSFTKEICQVCAEICEACAVACDHYHNDHCRRCARACRNCAEECWQMPVWVAKTTAIFNED